jgi:hypothetical protein|tara:strand:+ start:241 stop:756 length:516 start_codon:yes stop_codon:yes gene_type:complete
MKKLLLILTQNTTMKRLLLILLCSIGLNQIQAQIMPCDSISVTGSQSQITFEINSIPAFVANWQTVSPDSIIFQQDSMTNIHNVLNYNSITGMSYDTLTTCVTYGNPLNFCCVIWIWDGMTWARMGIPTGINELETWKDDGIMYDMLGRELVEINVGDMYIKNNKKYIRAK